MGSKKGSKGTRGPAPLGGQRTEFARLISIGVSNSEACRRVGVNRPACLSYFERVPGVGASHTLSAYPA